jgi:hypothetical protein
MNNNEHKSGPNPHIGGAKRKNGHKHDCNCHICENIKNKAKRGGYEEDMKKHQLKRMGGSKKKNGHKPDCNCPICKNMQNSKKTKGGKEDSDSDSDSDSSSYEEDNIGGNKKKKRGNGHKVSCGCPICKNMKKSKNKKGGDEPNIQEGEIKVDKNILDITENEIPADAEEYDKLDLDDNSQAVNIGGKRKKRLTRKNKSRKTSRGRKTKRYYKKNK